MAYQQHHIWKDDIFSDEKITAKELTKLCNQMLTEQSIRHYQREKKLSQGLDARPILQPLSVFREKIERTIQNPSTQEADGNAIIMMHLNSGTEKTSDYDHLAMHEAIAIILENIRKNDAVTQISDNVAALFLENIPDEVMQIKIEELKKKIYKKIRMKWCKLYHIHMEQIIPGDDDDCNSIIRTLSSDRYICNLPVDSSTCAECRIH